MNSHHLESKKLSVQEEEKEDERRMSKASIKKERKSTNKDMMKSESVEQQKQIPLKTSRLLNRQGTRKGSRLNQNPSSVNTKMKSNKDEKSSKTPTSVAKRSKNR